MCGINGIISKEKDKDKLIKEMNKRIVHRGPDAEGIYIDDEDLEIYDGFVMIGGGKIHPYHIQVIDYAIRNNKPFLGICMGMQALAIYFLVCKEKEKRNYSGSIINLYEELRTNKYNYVRIKKADERHSKIDI